MLFALLSLVAGLFLPDAKTGAPVELFGSQSHVHVAQGVQALMGGAMAEQGWT